MRSACPPPLPALDLVAPAQELAFLTLNPDEAKELVLAVPGQIVPGQVLVVEMRLSWDLNGNGAIQFLQFDETSFDRSPPCPPDLDGDGVVDGADLGALLGGWGGCGAA